MSLQESVPVFNTPEGKIAKEIAVQYISKKVGKPLKMKIVRKEADLMLRLTNEIESKYELTLNNMCNRLKMNNDNAGLIFSELANEIFRDGINWGRIIVLYALGGKIAENAKQNNNDDLIDKVSYWVASFVAGKASWIKETGNGWNGFIEQFRQADPEFSKENSWFQGLFAATLGFGTLAAALYIKS